MSTSPNPVPVATSTGEPLQDVIIGLSFTPDDGSRQWELYDCYPEEVANLLPALEKIRRRRWWETKVKSLTITSRNGKRIVVFGDRITFVTVRPSRISS